MCALKATLNSALFLLSLPGVFSGYKVNNSMENDSAVELVQIGGPKKPENLFSYFKTFANILEKNINLDALDAIEQVHNKKCIQDIFYALESFLAGKMWAFQMLDSQGKLPTGVLLGKTKWPGNPRECQKVSAPLKRQTDAGNFNGRYCNLGFSIGIQSQVVAFKTGVCVPDSCDPEHVIEDIPKITMNLISVFPFLGQLQSPARIDYLACSVASKPSSTPGGLLLFFTALLILVTLVGSSLTAYDYLTGGCPHSGYALQRNADFHDKVKTSDVSPKSDAGPSTAYKAKFSTLSHLQFGFQCSWEAIRSFLSCFCIFTNVEKLFSTEPTEGHLFFLHGFRFLSFSWIFLCHIYANSVMVIGNVFQMLESLDNRPGEIIFNGFFAVDSFIFMGGFLVGYVFFRECAKTGGNISWYYFYLHRYIRLTPVYMVVIAIFAVAPYFLVDNADFVDPACKNFRWLWNLLYLNNFLDEFCMGWSWYLALDMQFFVISPLYLITLWRRPKIGYSAVVITIVISSIINFAISYHFHIFAGLSNVYPSVKSLEEFGAKSQDFLNKIFDKPYTRISPYLIGIALAYYLSERKNNPPKLNMVTLLWGWTTSTVTAFTCIFSTFHQKENVFMGSVFNALSHVLFTLCLAWIFYTCSTGQGPINSLLSWKIFVPLSRLTYCAYLVHLLIIRAFLNQVVEPIEANHMALVTLFLGLLPVTYIGAFIMYMVCEAPVLQLERMLSRKFKTS